MNCDELSSDVIELTDFTLDLLLVNQVDRPSQVHDCMGGSSCSPHFICFGIKLMS